MSATRELFKNSNYCYYLFARVFLSFTVTILSVALGWHIYQATGDAMAIAYVGFVQVAPSWLLFLVTGWVADNFSRRNILLVAIGVQLITFAAIAQLMQQGVGELWLLYSVLFVNSCARAFIGPTMQTVLPNIVPKPMIPQAVSVASTIWQTAMTAGPFIAGLLIDWIDVGVYWLILVAVALCFIGVSQLPPFKMERSQNRAIKDIVEGIKFLRKNPYVYPSMAIDLFAMMLGGVTALLPIYALDILHVGATELGAMRAMPGVGSVIAGLIISRFGDGGHSGRALFASLGVFALSILLFGLSESLWLSLFALAIFGATDMVSVIIRSNILHIATPDKVRGRVNAVNALFITTSNEMGDFRAGAMAAWIGAVPAVLLGSASAFGVMFYGMWRYKAMFNMKSVDEIATD